MNTSKIKFTAVSIGWTMGGVIDLSIKASVGSKISIGWGDGCIVTHSFALNLDLSACPELEDLYYEGYVLGDKRSLDVSRNTALKELCCKGNKLKSLDLSNNTALEVLHCVGNCLTHLNLSNNIALKKPDTANTRRKCWWQKRKKKKMLKLLRIDFV